MPSIKLHLGKTVRRLRLKRKLTQQRLAELSELDYKYIQSLEGKNPTRPRLDTLVKLAKGLGIRVSSLVREIEKG